MRSDSCDIFCNVVDNYGDIGVCWRLARQLANEHGLAVRLWVDDLASFRRLCPDADATLDVQRCRGVEIRHWMADFHVIEPAGLVIEAFACTLPEPYVTAMATMQRKPVWINLEYLSAEDWVEGCHKLPSPHPRLPLTKYFFFPGFTEKTGGLLLEHDLLAQRDAFQSDNMALDAYWRSLGVPEHMAGEVRVSMFGYENEAMEGLLRGWEQGDAAGDLPAAGRSFLAAGGALFSDNRPARQAMSGSAAACACTCCLLSSRSATMNCCGRATSILCAARIPACVPNGLAKPFIWQIYPAA